MIGTQIIADLHDCDFIHDGFEFFIRDLKSNVVKNGANTLSFTGYNFSKKAYTLCLLLAESHLAIHTWPEKKFVSIDIFTCGKAKTDNIIDFIIETYKPQKVNKKKLKRGKKS